MTQARGATRWLVPVLLLVVAGTLVGCWFLLWRESAGAEPVGGTAQESGVDPRRDERPRSEPVGSAVRPGPPPPALAERTPAADEAGGGGWPRMRGRVALFDVAGAPPREVEGHFQPLFWPLGEGPPTDPVEIHAGAFELPISEQHSLELQDLVLDGVAAWTTQRRYALQADSVLVVQARLSHAVTLRVVDANSGQELDGVALRRGPAHFPDAATELLDGAPSPVRVEQDRTRDYAPLDSIWVGASGYGWSEVRVDYASGGEQRVALEPGASLQVMLVGAVQRLSEALPGRPELRLHPLDPADRTRSVAIRRIPADSRSPGHALELPGIAPGEYRVSVEAGDLPRPLVLGSQTVRLAAGAMRQIVIEIEPAVPLPPRVPLAGTLRIAAGWAPEQEPSIRLRPVELHGAALGWQDPVVLYFTDLTQDDGIPGSYRWSAGPLRPGRYSLSLASFGHEETVDTGPGGRTDLAVEIGSPAHLLVQVFEEGSENPLQVSRLYVPIEGSPWPRWDADHRIYRLVVPVGELPLTLWDHDHETLNVTHQVPAGTSRLELTLRRSCGLALKFFHRGEPVERRHLEKFEIELFAGTQPVPSEWYYSDHFTLRSASPGPGRLTVQLKIPGYRPTPPFLVDVPQGRFVERVVELEAEE